MTILAPLLMASLMIVPIYLANENQEERIIAVNNQEKILLEDRTKRQARLYKLKKSDQLDTLKSLGLSGSMLDALKYEEDRVRKIEELYDKNK